MRRVLRASSRAAAKAAALISGVRVCRCLSRVLSAGPWQRLVARSAMAPGSRSPSTMLVDQADFQGLGGFDGLGRKRSISAALARPTSRGRRWVPSAPGMMPRLASGSPRLRVRRRRRDSGPPWRLRARRRGPRLQWRSPRAWASLRWRPGGCGCWGRLLSRPRCSLRIR